MKSRPICQIPLPKTKGTVPWVTPVKRRGQHAPKTHKGSDYPFQGGIGPRRPVQRKKKKEVQDQEIENNVHDSVRGAHSRRGIRKNYENTMEKERRFITFRSYKQN
jgi:hypothetical protein